MGRGWEVRQGNKRRRREKRIIFENAGKLNWILFRGRVAQLSNLKESLLSPSSSSSSSPTSYWLIINLTLACAARFSEGVLLELLIFLLNDPPAAPPPRPLDDQIWPPTQQCKGDEYQQPGLIKNFYLLTENFAVYLLSNATAARPLLWPISQSAPYPHEI